jgi:hypothetical protein
MNGFIGEWGPLFMYKPKRREGVHLGRANPFRESTTVKTVVVYLVHTDK